MHLPHLLFFLLQLVAQAHGMGWRSRYLAEKEYTPEHIAELLKEYGPLKDESLEGVKSVEKYVGWFYSENAQIRESAKGLKSILKDYDYSNHDVKGQVKRLSAQITPETIIKDYVMAARYYKYVSRSIPDLEQKFRWVVECLATEGSDFEWKLQRRVNLAKRLEYELATFLTTPVETRIGSKRIEEWVYNHLNNMPKIWQRNKFIRRIDNQIRNFRYSRLTPATEFFPDEISAEPEYDYQSGWLIEPYRYFYNRDRLRDDERPLYYSYRDIDLAKLRVFNDGENYEFNQIDIDVAINRCALTIYKMMKAALPVLEVDGNQNVWEKKDTAYKKKVALSKVKATKQQRASRNAWKLELVLDKEKKAAKKAAKAEKQAKEAEEKTKADAEALAKAKEAGIEITDTKVDEDKNREEKTKKDQSDTDSDSDSFWLE